MIHAYKFVALHTTWCTPDGEKTVIIAGPRKITLVKMGNKDEGLMATQEDMNELHRLIVDTLEDNGSGIIIVPDHVSVEQYEV